MNIECAEARMIPLTKGLFAVVDDSDFQAMAEFKWQAHWNKSGRRYYARRCQRGDRKKIYMHRQLLGFPDCDVDHRDGDGLNNQRGNLRVATRRQNSINAKIQKNNTSGIRGVSRTATGRWTARIKVPGGKYKSLGGFATKQEAASAYSAAESMYFDFEFTSSANRARAACQE